MDFEEFESHFFQLEYINNRNKEKKDDFFWESVLVKILNFVTYKLQLPWPPLISIFEPLRFVF